MAKFRWLGVALVACAKSGGEPGVLQPDDLVSGPLPFDANEIVDTASLGDREAFDGSQIQTFLEHTPYGRPSFLATYQVNGVRASDAIARTAIRYGVNPIALLARIEMDGGLVGQEAYPSPPSRVEYVFGCGCRAPGVCDAAYAGIDTQLACLAGALRQSLAEIAASKKTAGGWGPGLAAATLDGLQVTPHDEATAALYQYTPRVGLGAAGGNWLFWNLWHKYADFLEYAGPVGHPGPLAWIGDACQADATCNYEGGVCATNYPGGMCTASCTGDCPPPPPAEPQAFCASFGDKGFCLAVCNPSVPVCRSGYSCKAVQQFGNAATAQYVCVAN